MRRLAVLAAAVPTAALAHGTGQADGLAALLDAALIGSIALATALYLRGCQARSRPQHRRDALAAAGLVLLLIALISPLDRLSAESLSAHMAQHMLLAALIPPLWAAARPGTAVLRGLPVALRRLLARWRGLPLLRQLARALRSIPATGLLHGAALWFWHLPTLYVAAVEHELLHAFEHLTLLGSGLLFWRAVLLAPRRDLGRGLLWLLLTLMHTGLLGALLTLSPHLLYAVHDGPNALADQQLAGLVMWVPMGVVYLVAGQWLALRLLRESGPRPRTA
jgi:cytochrome c oxidase assembly factor CtaG